MEIQPASILTTNLIGVNHYEIQIGPFKPYFGAVVGNTLRRMLITHIPGYAITHVSIPEAIHEYQLMPFLGEDLILFLNNLKAVEISLNEDVSEQCITLELQGPCTLKAGQLMIKGVTVYNPDFLLASITKDVLIQLSFRIALGRGFTLSSKHEIHEPFTLAVSSIFNPIKTCNFEVFVDTDSLEYLTLNLKTNGSISPAKAISHALEYVQIQLQVFYNIDDNLSQNEEVLEEIINKNIPDTIDKLGLTVRSLNCLQSIGIYTVNNLIEHTEIELLKIPNLGRKSLREIILVLQNYDLTLKKYKELL